MVGLVTSIVFQGRCSLSWERCDLREDPLLEGCDLKEDQLSSAQPDVKEATARGTFRAQVSDVSLRHRSPSLT